MAQAMGNNDPAADGAMAKRKHRPITVLLALTSVALLSTYVETMVIPGIPRIQKDFSTTAGTTSWITSALLIVGSAVSPVCGKLGDTYGKKKMYMIVMAFYIAGVGIAGFAPTIYFLILARAVQGVGLAIAPLAIAIIADVFPKERLAPAQGIISGTFAIGASAGLIIGSYIVQDLGWQWAFHTAFVLSVILFAVVWKVVEGDRPGQKTKVDYAGAAILMSGITLVLVYLTEGPSLGWYSYEEMAMLVPGVILTIFFFVYESRITSPMIHLGLLKIPNVFISNMVGLASGVAMFLLFFGLIYYAELPTPFGLGLDIITAGLVGAPATLIMLVVGPFAGRMTTRLGPKPVLILGSLVSILGITLFIVNRGTRTDLTLDAAVSFVGIVYIIIPIVNMISLSLPRENVTVGLGMNTMLRNVGGAIGPVLATTIMTTYTTPLVEQIAGHPFTVAQFPSSYAFNLIFAIAIGLMATTCIMSLFVRNYTFPKATAQPLEPEIQRSGTEKQPK